MKLISYQQHFKSLNKLVSYIYPNLEAPCPENVTVMIAREETTALVNWTTPYGSPVQMRLPVGESIFLYALEDGTDCYFTVSVKSSK